ncbi:MAG TPA: DNA-packaging protein [Bacteroidia bacterium]|nr:DNA-packaging protein [Bacteroidia bacterium]
MGAPEGNQFWKLRSKHGRDILFATPELLWDAACEYFEWCDENKLMEVDFRGKDADRVNIPHMRPYTLHGLCLYLDCGTAYFRNFNPPNEDFKSVITRITETIYNQKFEGAAAGFLNPNIIARDLGLTEKTEVKAEVKSDMNFDNLSTEDLESLATALDKLNAH